MFRLILMLAMTLGLTLGIQSAAQAGRFTCKAAQNLARVGALDRDTVVVDPDDARKECRFSINGEPAGSPPRGAIISGINILRAGQPAEELLKNVDWLAFILLAASREDGIPQEVRTQLSAHKIELSNCFKALEQNTMMDFPSFTNDRDTFCRALPSGGGEFGFAGEYRIEVVNVVPNMIVGVKRANGASFLFIPFKLFRGQPLQ